MLQTSGRSIVKPDLSPIRLKGLALGGWLMMEGYMLGGENIPESRFKSSLAGEVGPELAEEFAWEFRQRFVTPADAELIKKLGFNCVRIPFNHRLLKDGAGIKFLKTAVKYFTGQKLYVILDMHAVPGSQNPDWHSDSGGRPLFWQEEKYRQEYVELWGMLSSLFKDEELIAGYDIMNEPVTDNIPLLQESYRRVIDIIRKNNDDHIIFLEGNFYAQKVEMLKDLLGKNIALSIHFYEPVKFTFNEDPSLCYPGTIEGKDWDRDEMRRRLEQYTSFNAPVYCGEFGVASNRGKGELQWVKDAISLFREFGFHWTYWTYKSIAPMPLPDGLFQKRLPPDKAGMKNVGRQLLENKRIYYEGLDTNNFRLNRELLGSLVA